MKTQTVNLSAIKLVNLLLSTLALWGASACNEATDFTAVETNKRGPRSDRDADPFPASKLSRDFPAARIERGVVLWAPDRNQIVETVQIRKPASTSLSLTQFERTKHVESATQGYDGSDQTERFSLWEAGRLDILVVMDNSNTMEPYQERAASRLEPLLQHIGNTDWKIAVVTTDSPCVRGVVTKAQYSNDAVGTASAFAAAVRAGTRGSNVERGVEMAIKGFSAQVGCSVANQWTRSDSRKAAIVITDEANCGSASNETCSGQYQYFGPDEFMAQAPANTRLYGILYDQATCEYNGYEKQPTDYYELATRTGGLWRPICVEDYRDVLGEISRDVGRTLVRSFDLAAPPEAHTVSVWLDGVATNSGYHLNGKSLQLDGDANGAQQIEIRYRHGSAPRIDEIAINHAVSPETFEVKVGGQRLNMNEFEYNAENGKLHFSRRPADYSVIEINYREPGALLSRFPVPPGVLGSSIRVLVNGGAVEGALLDELGGEMVFEQAPADGSTIVISGSLANDYQLEYPLTMRGLVSAEEIRVRDQVSGDYVDAVLTENGIELSAETIDRYDSLEVVYDLEVDESGLAIALPQQPIRGTVEVIGSDAAKQCVTGAALRERTLSLTCLASVQESFEIHYDYVAERFSKFQVDLPVNAESATWSVLVDGQPVAYQREGRSFSIDEKLLTAQSTVRVEVEDSTAVN